MRLIDKCYQKIRTHFASEKPLFKYGAYFVLTIIITVVISNEFVTSFLNDFGPLALATSLLFLTALLWFIAGIVVFRALFEIGASFSLMIFIAQSFCSIENVPSQNLDALKSLFWFGIAFVIVRFINELWVQLYGNKKAKPEATPGLFNDPNNIPPKGMVTLCAIAIGLFLWQLYLVLGPIVQATCAI